MNTYIAFHKGKRIEIEANTSYHAQRIAAADFAVRKPYEVAVVIAAKDGVAVVHAADF